MREYVHFEGDMAMKGTDRSGVFVWLIPPLVSRRIFGRRPKKIGIFYCFLWFLKRFLSVSEAFWSIFRCLWATKSRQSVVKRGYRISWHSFGCFLLLLSSLVILLRISKQPWIWLLFSCLQRPFTPSGEFSTSSQVLGASWIATKPCTTHENVTLQSEDTSEDS